MNNSNTPLEVMKAIVANGGPVLAWVSNDVTSWSEIRCKLYGVLLQEECPYRTSAGPAKYASLTNPHPQPNKRHMTPLEAYEFLAEGNEGKPRVWRDKEQADRWYPSGYWDSSQRIDTAQYANLYDRDGDRLIWRKFPQIND